MGRISFKYPQYYEFMRLCDGEGKKVVVYNEYYWEIFSNRKKGNTQHDDEGEYYFNKNLNKKYTLIIKKQSLSM